MIQSITAGPLSKDKKLLAEAQQMLQDSKAKIEYLKMRILKMKNNLNSRQHGSLHDLSSNGDGTQRELDPPLEERIEDLRHRLRIEAAVVEGAKNVIKLLQSGSKEKTDKKALQEVCIYLIFFCFLILDTFCYSIGGYFSFRVHVLSSYDLPF